MSNTFLSVTKRILLVFLAFAAIGILLLACLAFLFRNYGKEEAAERKARNDEPVAAVMACRKATENWLLPVRVLDWPSGATTNSRYSAYKTSTGWVAYVDPDIGGTIINVTCYLNVDFSVQLVREK